MLPGKIAYYKMPAVIIGSDSLQMRKWANLLTDSIQKLEAQKPAAYIIDLRMNNGGNFEPMWETLKGLIGEENKTLLADAGEKIIEEQEDSLWKVYKPYGIPANPVKFRKNLPVAVLIGPGTASSGEIIAAGFLTRKKTKIFGEPSIGLANTTQGFIIQYKGYLLLTVANIATADRKPVKESVIRPHVEIKADDNYENPELDPTVQAAMKWLRKK